MAEKIMNIVRDLEKNQKYAIFLFVILIILIPYYPIITYYYFGPLDPLIPADNHSSPLRFDSNFQIDLFPNFTADDTMNGTSWTVPYVFENLIISESVQDWDNPNMHSLMLSNINRYIIIRNCIFGYKIYLKNCTNIKIERCFMKDNSGVLLIQSHGCKIENNRFYYISGNDSIAIEILLSNYNNITFNEISRCTFGIKVGSLKMSLGNIISHNSITYNREEGISVYSENIGNLVSNNLLMFNTNKLGQYAPYFIMPFFFIPPIYIIIIALKNIFEIKHVPKPKDDDFSDLI